MKNKVYDLGRIRLIFFPIHNYDSSEAQIYRRGHKYWAQCQADEIQQEIVPHERIVIQEDPSDVSQHFARESEKH
jgi:hypothetical protein